MQQKRVLDLLKGPQAKRRRSGAARSATSGRRKNARASGGPVADDDDDGGEPRGDEASDADSASSIDALLAPSDDEFVPGDAGWGRQRGGWGGGYCHHREAV